MKVPEESVKEEEVKHSQMDNDMVSEEDEDAELVEEGKNLLARLEELNTIKTTS